MHRRAAISTHWYANNSKHQSIKTLKRQNNKQQNIKTSKHQNLQANLRSESVFSLLFQGFRQALVSGCLTNAFRILTNAVSRKNNNPAAGPGDHGPEKRVSTNRFPTATNAPKHWRKPCLWHTFKADPLPFEVGRPCPEAEAWGACGEVGEHNCGLLPSKNVIGA
jgi:hypothetical protein